jgi:hypothetical protein
VNVFDMATDTAAKLKPYVDALTSQGVVVELEDHNYPAVLTGSDLMGWTAPAPGIDVPQRGRV